MGCGCRTQYIPLQGLFTEFGNNCEYLAEGFCRGTRGCGEGCCSRCRYARKRLCLKSHKFVRTGCDCHCSKRSNCGGCGRR